MSLAENVYGQLGFTANFLQYAGESLAGSPLSSVIQDILQYANANGVNYGVDQLYANTASLVATTANLHFQTATLKDPFGNTLAMLRIRELIIKNTATTLGYDLLVAASSSDGIAWLPPIADAIPIAPGGVLRISDPLSYGSGVGRVISSTTDGLYLSSGSNTVPYQILVLGNSTA